MNTNIFAEIRFWLLIAFSLVLPFCIYGMLLFKRAVSRGTTLFFGFALVLLAGVDVFLLQSLGASARQTPSLADDVWFVSELSVALYLLPALFAGIGINVVSHVLVRHLTEAEAQFERENPPSMP